MKLTQKTLFQCFEKSRSQSSPSTPPCQSQIEIPVEARVCPTPQIDFLLPIHVRQCNPASMDSIPLLNTRKLTELNSFSSNEEFYRICPTIINRPKSLPKLQFIPIVSPDRQMELLEQYTAEQSNIPWKSIFEGLQDYRKKAIEQNQHGQLLWTDLYRPKTSKTYLGNHTYQVKRLNEWFSYWTKRLQSEQPKRIFPKKRKRPSNDDDDDDFSENSNMSSSSTFEHPQLIFIHGTGTTSLVHALTEEYNFKITEINGSQSRARAPLLKHLEQVTSHHQLAFKRCPSDSIISQDDPSKSNREVSSPLPAKKKAKTTRASIVSYFNTSKKPDGEQKENQSPHLPSEKHPAPISINETIPSKKRRSKGKLEAITIPTDNHLVSSVQVEKTSLIFFDEIETLTDDDQFWSCLKKLLETARKPIILTSNSRVNPEDAIINLSKIGYYELIHLQSNEPESICSFLRLILLNEMFEVPTLDQLMTLFHACSSDLRQTISTLQFLVQSSVEQFSHQETSPLPIAFPHWQSSLVFDAMFYSHLAEQPIQSPLKTLFDDLTRDYTSIYTQSNRLLHTSIQNNVKRLELYDTFKLFMQEQEIGNINDHPSFYLDYRPYTRQICQNEQHRTIECQSNRRLRHHLAFRGCTLQWSDFEILSSGID